jgi:hypothetical protein
MSNKWEKRKQNVVRWNEIEVLKKQHETWSYHIYNLQMRLSLLILMSIYYI